MDNKLILANEQTNQMTDLEFKRFCDLIYQNSGIHLNENKKELVNSRLAMILRERNFLTYTDYYKTIKNDTTGQELVLLLDAITTNQTYFFRENDHFIFLKENILPELTNDKKLINKITIWSAGCSSGEEPYSLALTLKEYFSNSSTQWDTNILATDLSTRMLKKAESGIYHESEFDKVPEHLIKIYFQYGTGKWKYHLRVKKELRNMINFRRMNLLDSLRQTDRFDIIFCRNVLIYFDLETIQKVISLFNERLNSKGYLIVGHSESLSNVKHNFKYIKPTIYKKG